MSNDPQADPYLLAIEEAIFQIETHAAQNRTHQEQGLYTEALPRITTALRRILEAIDTDQEEEQEPAGALVAIRYQTASAVEKMLTELFQKNPAQDRLASVLFLLLEDLHGIDQEEILAVLLKTETTTEPTEPTTQTTTEPTEPTTQTTTEPTEPTS